MKAKVTAQRVSLRAATEALLLPLAPVQLGEPLQLAFHQHRTSQSTTEPAVQFELEEASFIWHEVDAGGMHAWQQPPGSRAGQLHATGSSRVSLQVWGSGLPSNGVHLLAPTTFQLQAKGRSGLGSLASFSLKADVLEVELSLSMVAAMRCVLSFYGACNSQPNVAAPGSGPKRQCSAAQRSALTAQTAGSPHPLRSSAFADLVLVDDLRCGLFSLADTLGSQPGKLVIGYGPLSFFVLLLLAYLEPYLRVRLKSCIDRPVAELYVSTGMLQISMCTDDMATGASGVIRERWISWRYPFPRKCAPRAVTVQINPASGN